MKILIIYRIFIDDISTYGIVEKQESQADAFRKLGHECDTLAINGEGFCLNRQIIKEANFRTEPFKSFNLISRFFRRIPSILEQTYDLYYVRFSPISSDIGDMIGQLSDVVPGSKVILDFPTFPFLNEYQGIKKWIANNYQKTIKTYSGKVFKATVLDDRKVIFDIPCVKIENAVDVDKLSIKNDEKGDHIELLFVGNLTKSQGLDRVILGIINAKEEIRQKFKLTIIGAGKEDGNLKALATPIRNRVTFITNKYGKELNPYFNAASLGLGNLGIHRIGLGYSSGLKHREYCARGLPFVYSCKDSIFDEQNFIIKVSPDDSPLDFEMIYYKFLTIEQEPARIRAFAEKKIDWSTQMQKIVEAVSL